MIVGANTVGATCGFRNQIFFFFLEWVCGIFQQNTKGDHC